MGAMRRPNRTCQWLWRVAVNERFLLWFVIVCNPRGVYRRPLLGADIGMTPELPITRAAHLSSIGAQDEE